MTYNEVIYSIREGVRQYSDDSSLSNRYIEFEVAVERAALIYTLYKKKDVPSDYLQTICISTELVPNSECGCVDEECTILRGVSDIPPTIGNIKVGAGTKDSIPFDSISWNRFIHSGFNRYNQKTIFASLHTDDKAYIKSKDNLHKLIPCIYVTGIFENPSDAATVSECTDRNTAVYPIEMAVFSAVQEKVVNKILRALGVPMDDINNAKDDVQRKAN